MDLTSAVFTTILSPVAAFLPPPEQTPTLPPPTPQPGSSPPLRPTSPPPPPSTPPSPKASPHRHWEITAISPTGTLFLATPSFTLHRPPLRIDICVPPPEAFPPSLRALVKPDRGMIGLSSAREMTTWLGGVLENWLVEQGGEVERQWWGLPFGSVVVVDFEDGGEVPGVRLVARYGVEQGMVGVEVLRGMWDGWDGVEVVEWERLGLRTQVHETVAVVEVDGEGELAFKSVLRGQRWMYNELKMLLGLAPHPNVVPRPRGVVVKKSRFGGRKGVCGFLLEWYPLGSLRERLLREDYFETMSVAQMFRWAVQITEALIHINGHHAGFYPDLKPDNIMLREDPESGMLDAVLIDLEQRGGWFAWSPPEVAYIEYLELLVADPRMPEGEAKEGMIEQLREYYGNPGWTPGPGSQLYDNPDGGFSGPWLALLSKAQKLGSRALNRAQVFMLGKLLWCIFEGQPLVRCGIDHEILRDPDPGDTARRVERVMAFPEFKRSPEAVRPLIEVCTTGAPEWDTSRPRPSGVVLRSGKLYPATVGADPSLLIADNTLRAVKSFWQYEVERARTYLRAMVLLRGVPQAEQQELGPPLSSADMGWATGLLVRIETRPVLSEILELLQLLHLTHR
ncbi:U-box domain-protein 33 [Staphylotrichum tortipilum]|uniref:U-box domain-protein 33 n=1 Tax=Staphylotrichum tortipilum TaxID=2831512 RepID=A0AAN6MDW0_9PEZI|nr:U-box domain-protein 33 [Staphylotrichum longicolle]